MGANLHLQELDVLVVVCLQPRQRLPQPPDLALLASRTSLPVELPRGGSSGRMGVLEFVDGGEEALDVSLALIVILSPLAVYLRCLFQCSLQLLVLFSEFFEFIFFGRDGPVFYGRFRPVFYDGLRPFQIPGDTIQRPQTIRPVLQKRRTAVVYGVGSVLSCGGGRCRRGRRRGRCRRRLGGRRRLLRRRYDWIDDDGRRRVVAQCWRRRTIRENNLVVKSWWVDRRLLMSLVVESLGIHQLQFVVESRVVVVLDGSACQLRWSRVVVVVVVVVVLVLVLE